MPKLIAALALAAAALLSACGGKAPAPDHAAYRNPGAPIWSIAAFDPTRLAGTWTEVAAFAPEGAACRPGGIEIARTPGELAAKGRLCRSGIPSVHSGALRPTGLGRLTMAGEAEPWWVLWVDTDYRTLVIGTPSGRFGYILNRNGALPPDRMKAAREILDWNGYDLAGLRVLR